MASLDVSELKGVLEELIELLESDGELDEEVRESLVDLVTESIGDPTPGNLRTLAHVLGEVAKTERYLRALEIVAGAAE